MTELDVATARWLITEEGRAAITAARALLDTGVRDLDLLERLRGSGFDVERASGIVRCARAPRRGEMVFTREASEQASPAIAAEWRAKRFANADLVVDVACGAGADAIALGAVTRVVGMDIDESRVVLADHNLAVAGVDAHVLTGDALQPPFYRRRFVHVDPARRAGGKRIRRADAYAPPVDALLAAYDEAPGMCILVSPGIDLDDPSLPRDAEFEFIQIGADLVECAVWIGSLKGRSSATATSLPSGLSIGRGDEPHRVAVGPLGAFLVEPIAAAVRARVHEMIGAERGMRRIAKNRALLTADNDPGESPWWRRWRVEAELPLRARTVATWLKQAEPQPIEISLHGYQADVDALWRSFGKPLRGPQGRRLFVVRESERMRVIICAPVQAVGPGPRG